MTEKIISAFNPDGVGALQFSIYQRSESSLNAKDYLEMMLSNQNLDAKAIEENKGTASTSFITDGKHWKYWLIQKKDVLIFVTYNSDESESDSDKESDEIHEIVQSISI